MKRILTFLLCLLSLTAFGQGLFVSWNRFVPQITSSELPSGIAFRWVASDLASSPVSLWTDRIQGYNWAASGGARPSWDASGITFDGVANSMTGSNTIFSATSTNSWLVVLKWNSTTADKMVLCNACAGGQVFLALTTGAKIYDGGSTGPGLFGTVNTTDILITKTTNATPYVVYTNGLSSWTSGSAFNDMGVIAAVDHLGSGVGNCFWSGVMKEIIIWTNTVFTANQVSNIHYYSTNTYAITP